MLTCYFKNQSVTQWAGPYAHIIVNGGNLYVGQCGAWAATLNEHTGRWSSKLFRGEFEEINVMCDERRGIRATFYRGLGKPPLIGHKLPKLKFVDKLLVNGMHQTDKEMFAHLDNGHWRIEDDKFKSIQITDAEEPLCSFCGNVFIRYIEGELYQCLLCQDFFKIPTPPAAKTH